jgi:hypothetical protein
MLKSLNKPLVAAGFVLASLSAPALAEHGYLSGQDIQATLAGATAHGNANGKGYTVEYAEDGSAKFKMNDNSRTDSGTWTVENDFYCAQWRKIRNGAKGCWKLMHKGGQDYIFEGQNGSEDFEAKIMK